LNHEVSIARRCAQIKQIIRLASYQYIEKDKELIFGINGDWVEFCVACDKVLDKG